MGNQIISQELEKMPHVCRLPDIAEDMGALRRAETGAERAWMQRCLNELRRVKTSEKMGLGKTPV